MSEESKEAIKNCWEELDALLKKWQCVLFTEDGKIILGYLPGPIINRIQ